MDFSMWLNWICCLHTVSSELQHHEVSTQVSTPISCLEIQRKLMCNNVYFQLITICARNRKFDFAIEKSTSLVIPAQAWVLVAPRCTPPMRSQSHHLRWSSSGSPLISSPFFLHCEPPCPALEEEDVPPFHCAPGSSYTGAANKKRGFRNHIHRATPFTLYLLPYPSSVCLLLFLNYIVALPFTFLLLVAGWPGQCWSRIVWTLNSSAFQK